MKRHDAVFDDVLKGIGSTEPSAAPDDRAAGRFLNRTSALAETGEREEKVLRWVDPGRCRMWARHNRAYEFLSEENCRDLIDSLKAQGQQEFPAIVRRLPKGQGADYEVICGARRHFAVSWLRAHNYPQFKYLIEVRDLTDEEAFRLSDIENRDREDISDLERARDYASALELYYNGLQKEMAKRLEVSEAWLSRYLNLARLPSAIVAAFASIRDLKEAHARALRPLLQNQSTEARVLAVADDLAKAQAAAAAGQGAAIPAPKVLSRLKEVAARPRTPRPPHKVYQGGPGGSGVAMRRKKGKITLEFDESLPVTSLRVALEKFLADRSRDEGGG